MMGFGGLPWGTIWEVVKAIGGIGLFAFAAAQLWIQRRERQDRQRAAFGVVYADFVRVMAKHADWDGANLVWMAAQGKLYYDDIASSDWATVASSLGGLSVGGLALCSHAYALLHQAADSARLLASGKGGPVGAVSAQDLADHCRATLKRGDANDAGRSRRGPEARSGGGDHECQSRVARRKGFSESLP